MDRCVLFVFFFLSPGMELLKHSWLTLLPSLQDPRSHLYLCFILWSTEFQHDYIIYDHVSCLLEHCGLTHVQRLSFLHNILLAYNSAGTDRTPWVGLPSMTNDRPIFIKAQENKLNYCRILTAIAISFLEGNTW